MISLFNRGAAKPVPLVNIQNIRIAAPCPADWNKMIGDERVRHCAECNLNVYNLSAMTEREVQKLIARSHGQSRANMCLRSTFLGFGPTSTHSSARRKTSGTQPETAAGWNQD